MVSLRAAGVRTDAVREALPNGLVPTPNFYLDAWRSLTTGPAVPDPWAAPAEDGNAAAGV
jgi:hypothetical protein